MPAENKSTMLCIALVGLSFFLLMIFIALGHVFAHLSMQDKVPIDLLLFFGIILSIVIFGAIFSIVGLVALYRGKSIFPTFSLSRQSHQLAPINLRAGTAPNYGPQVMTTYRPTSSMGGQLAPMVLYSGPLPNNQHYGSNPNLGPYFGSNTTTLGPPSGPYNQFSRSDSNLARGPQFGPNVPQFSGPTSGPYNNQFSGPSSGPYNNQFSGPMGPSPPYNPNYMETTHENVSFPSAPPLSRDFNVNPPSFDDAIKK